LSESELPEFARPVMSEEDMLLMQDDSSKGAPATTSTNQSTSKSPQRPTTSTNFPDDVVKRLVELGFKRNDVINALTESNGDETTATIKLFANSLKTPQ
jgi:Holliday junction resolvasome RuvABC DNA-binding subunit